jgi:hypothetical protein
VEASKQLLGLPSSPQPLAILSVAPPDTHRRLKLNLRCVSGGATEGLRCGVGEIGCASASTVGAGTSGYGSHEGSDWFEIGHGGSRLRSAGRRTVTLVMFVSICGCELYSLCKRHSPSRAHASWSGRCWTTRPRAGPGTLSATRVGKDDSVGRCGGEGLARAACTPASPDGAKGCRTGCGLNLLDENFPGDQALLLRAWRIPFRRIGREVVRLGAKDPDIIPLLQDVPGVPLSCWASHCSQQRLGRERLATLEVSMVFDHAGG